MAKCFFCEFDALDGHLTCGMASCSEADARAQQHSERRWKRKPGSGALARREREALVYHSKESINEPIKDGLTTGVCGAENGYMKVRCALPFNHEGDLHATGALCWRRGERPRYMDDALKARLEPAMEPESDSDRLATLTQVLVTARSQMLGLGTGLEQALSSMPRAVDQHAVRGLIGALSHIVGHLDSFKLSEADAGFRKEARVGVDSITASAFDRGSPMARSGGMAERAASRPEVLSGAERAAHVAAKVLEVGRGHGKTVQTLPGGHREPVVHWRGSVSDLATDLDPLLSTEQVTELAGELVRRRLAGAGLALPFANPLRELVDELQTRLSSAEARMKELEAEKLAEKEKAEKEKRGPRSLYSAAILGFVELIERESRDAGQFGVAEREVLQALVGGVVGLPFRPPSDSAVLGDWGPACERLHRLGFLEDYAKQFRPTVRGMRHGLVLLGERYG